MTMNKNTTPKPIEWRSAWDYKADAAERANTDIDCKDASLTQQHFAADADLNVIAARFGIDGGQIPAPTFDPKYYGDFRNAPDFRTILDRVKDAKDRFDALPAKIRNRFENDPSKLLEFVYDPDNADEAVRLGILKRLPEEVKETPPAPPKETPAPTPVSK